MANEASTSIVKVVDLGGLAKPAELLVEKISEAIAGIAQPWQIRRVAKAEADAEEIRALADINIEQLQRRALARFVREEAKKQNNMEAITAKALPEIGEDAKPSEVEDDWIVNFFDKCRLISDEDMQRLWARVLAGEANSPGSYSKRTVNLLGSLDKKDAELFKNLCSFICYEQDGFEAFVYDPYDAIYADAGVTFDAVTHLDSVGLISYDHRCGFGSMEIPQNSFLRYFNSTIEIQFPNPDKNILFIGSVLLAKTGRELARIANPNPRDGFVDYLVKKLTARGHVVKGVHTN